MRFTRFLWFGAWVPSCLALSAAEVVVSGPIVELPPMVITTDQGPSWRYATMPGYEIFSCCPDAMTTDFMRGLQRAQALVRHFAPAAYWARSAVPRVVILSPPENLALMPRELLGEDVGEHTLLYGGESLTRDNSRVIPNIELGDQDSSMVFVTLDPVNFDRDRLMLHPGHVRDLLSQRRPPLPAWVVAGVMNLYGGLYRAQTAVRTESYAVRTVDQQLFSTALKGGEGTRLGRDTTSIDYRADKDAYSIPAQVWISDEATKELFKVAADQALRPAEEPGELGQAVRLQAVLAPPPSTESPDWPAWNAGATLLVRWALDGKASTRAAAMWRYVDLAGADQSAAEDAFRHAFGLGYEQATKELNDYLPIAVRRAMEFKLPEPKQPAPGIRPASRTEILRIREDWTRLVAGYLKTRFRGATVPEKPHRVAMQACAKGNRDPRLLAAVGLYELELGHVASARTELEAAIEAGVACPRAYLEVARLRYAEAGGPDGNGFDATQTDFVIAPLVRGLHLDPPMRAAYRLAAEVWLHSQGQVPGAQLQAIERGVEFFPGDMELLYKVALLNSRRGNKAAAADLAERGLRLGRDPGTRAEFEALQRR